MTLGNAFPVPEFLYAGNVPHVAPFFAGFILSLGVRCANICTLEETSFQHLGIVHLRVSKITKVVLPLNLNPWSGVISRSNVLRR